MAKTLDDAINFMVSKIKEFDNNSSMPYTGFIMWISKILKQIDYDEKNSQIFYRYLVYLGYVIEEKDTVIINPSKLQEQ